jgi:hypothetical protein
VPSVFDQLSWEAETSPETILQLVSLQLNAQEKIRLQIRKQLLKDYPPDAVSWIDTVTWNPPTLVPLTSFDLRGVEKWPTWQDKKKIATFIEKIKDGWHKPIVVVKTPGARFLTPLDGHTRLSVYWKLKRPPYAWVGKTSAASGPWDTFHRKQRGMTKEQNKSNLTSVCDQLLTIELGGSISEDQYQLFLLSRREARSAYPPGHPDRVSAERSVRKARKLRQPIEEINEDTRADVLEVVSHLPHTMLLAARREAQTRYPPGHPERVVAERAVRRSRSVRQR